MKKIAIISLICVLLDQIIKYIIVKSLSFSNSIHIIRNFLRITFVKNTGGAFSIFESNIFLLIILTLFVLFFIFYYLYKNRSIDSNNQFIYGILIGGIFGNLIDRIRLGYVIDYLDFNFFSYNFPIFNFADILIVISCILLMFKIINEGD